MALPLIIGVVLTIAGVCALDEWLTKDTYEEAREKLAQMRVQDASRVREIYEEHRSKMSPDVRRAFEEVLHA